MNAPTSIFDANSFLHATTTEVNERREPLPVHNPAEPSGLYSATIGEVKSSSGTIEKGDKAGQPWLSILVPLKVDIPQQLQEALGLPPQLTITDRVFIDLTADGRGIDNSKGKNRGQKRYRDATGTNVPGQTFAWAMLQGRPVKVKINHEIYEGNVQERVENVLPITA